jgi:hypothetical protein
MTPNEISEYIQFIFIKEFNEVSNPHPLAQIYSFKFLSTFRLQIPVEWLESTIGMLIRIINNQNVVISNACLLTLEKILFMKDINSCQNLAATAVNTESTFINLVSCLITIISKETNIFAMRCFYKTLTLTSENYFKPIIGSLADSINSVLQGILINPIEDQFNFYFFETVAIMMRKLSSSDIEQFVLFERSIRDTLLQILNNSLSDLMGYALQILALELSISENNLTNHNVFYNNTGYNKLYTFLQRKLGT